MTKPSNLLTQQMFLINFLLSIDQKTLKLLTFLLRILFQMKIKLLFSDIHFLKSQFIVR